MIHLDTLASAKVISAYWAGFELRHAAQMPSCDALASSLFVGADCLSWALERDAVGNGRRAGRCICLMLQPF
jgi:hypothetical protein